MALVLNGTSDYVGPYPPALPSAIQPTAVTVSCWVNLASLANAYTAIASINGAYYYQLFVTSAGKLAIYVGANAQVEYDPGTAILTTGKWYHLAFTYSAATGLAGYVNGVVDQTVAANGPLSNQTSLLALTFGTDLVNAGRFLNGSISDASLYNQALSATEIAQLASGLSPLGVRRDALVCYWPMKSGADRAVDLGPNSLPLYLAGSTILSTRAGDDPPFLIRPRYVLSSIPAEGEMPALFNPVVLATGNNPPARRQWTLLPRRGVASATKLPRGITAYWPLDASTCEFGSGQVRPLDLIGNNYGVDAKSAGIAGRPPTDIDGIGFNFDGTANNYLALNADPLGASSGQATSLTVAAWVYLRSYLTNELSAGFGPRIFQFFNEVQVLVDDGSTGAGPAGCIYAANNNTSVGIATASSLVPLNTWVHVAVTFVARSPTTIYVNGAVAALSATGNLGFSNANTTLYNIGCRDNAARIINGKIANAMICNGTVLTASEIADLYTSFFVAEEIMPALFLPSAGGSFLAAWGRNSNRPVIGTGNY